MAKEDEKKLKVSQLLYGVQDDDARFALRVLLVPMVGPDVEVLKELLKALEEPR